MQRMALDKGYIPPYGRRSFLLSDTIFCRRNNVDQNDASSPGSGGAAGEQRRDWCRFIRRGSVSGAGREVQLGGPQRSAHAGCLQQVGLKAIFPGN